MTPRWIARICLAVALLGSFATASSTPLYLVRENGSTQNDELLLFNGGVLTTVGAIGFGDVRGLAYDATTNTLYGVSRRADRLLTIDLSSGAGTPVSGAALLPAGSNTAEATFDSSGSMFLLGHTSTLCCLDTLYTADKSTGVATSVGALGVGTLTGLALQASTGKLFGTGFGGDFYQIDPGTGAATALGTITGANGGVARIAFDQSSDVLFGVSFNNQLVTVDLGTLAATQVAQFSGNQIYALDFVSAPLVPEPVPATLLAAGLVVTYLSRLRHQRCASAPCAQG